MSAARRGQVGGTPWRATIPATESRSTPPRRTPRPHDPAAATRNPPARRRRAMGWHRRRGVRRRLASRPSKPRWSFGPRAARLVRSSSSGRPSAAGSSASTWMFAEVASGSTGSSTLAGVASVPSTPTRTLPKNRTAALTRPPPVASDLPPGSVRGRSQVSAFAKDTCPRSRMAFAVNVATRLCKTNETSPVRRCLRCAPCL